jgi:membrane carboxypeptidase/penicillin-binding protein
VIVLWPFRVVGDAVLARRWLYNAITRAQRRAIVLARSFFLTRERTLKRKVSDAFIAVLLEHRLTKKQIFTMYANEVYLGEHGLYAMHGFREAAHALFETELRDLTLPEAATRI